jgi:hypothetical protein
MSFYRGNTIQTSQNLKYNLPCGGVKNLECEQSGNVKDWQVGSQQCPAFTSPQPICAAPDILECAVGKNDAGQNPLLSIKWNTIAPNITCLYDTSKMNSLNVIREYKNKFGETEDYNNMMINYCSNTLGKQCIVDPETKTPFTKCSVLRSSDSDGDYCREWFNRQNNAVQDTIVSNYCFKNGNAPDCKCVLRSFLDSKYGIVKQNSPFNDGCWYPPCANQTSYLVTSDLKNPTCPGNICQIVLNNLQNRDIKISDVQNSLNCEFQAPTPTPTPIPLPIPTPPTQPRPSQPSTFTQGDYIFLALFSSFFVITMGIVIYRIGQQNHNK